MNRVIPKVFRAIALVLFLTLLSVWTLTAQTNPSAEALKRMEMNYNSLTSLRASVTMDKYDAALGDHDLSEGTIMYIPQKGRDAAFRVDWTKPATESLSVINKQYVIYRPKLGQAYVGSVSGSKNNAKASSALAFINMSKAELQANYVVDYAGQENVSGNVPTWHLRLTPKKTTSFKTADLWVDVNGMPIQAKVTENNNDTTAILLSNLQKNATIRAADLPINPPKGTKIIKS